jgi:hypothetical protein
MDEQGSRGRVRSFLIGGVLGASAAIAAARRLRPQDRRRRGGSLVGLGAFERAPCFKEIVELEKRGQ